jgi:hypothetical protein
MMRWLRLIEPCPSANGLRLQAGAGVIADDNR